MPPEIKIVADPAELNRAAADEFANCAQTSLQAQGKFCVALAGGSTPRYVYSLLAENQKLPWQNIFVFFGDERHVPPTDAESNYRMAQESLLTKITIPAENVFRVPPENPDASTAASDYEARLRRFFQIKSSEFPRFDLILLCLGPDGHTA